MTEKKTVKHRKRLLLKERAEILRLTDEKGPEVIVQSQESYCILLVKPFFVDRSCGTAKLQRIWNYSKRCDKDHQKKVCDRSWAELWVQSMDSLFRGNLLWLSWRDYGQYFFIFRLFCCFLDFEVWSVIWNRCFFCAVPDMLRWSVDPAFLVLILFCRW